MFSSGKVSNGGRKVIINWLVEFGMFIKSEAREGRGEVGDWLVEICTKGEMREGSREVVGWLVEFVSKSEMREREEGRLVTGWLNLE
jgi:hypothetical protein